MYFLKFTNVKLKFTLNKFIQFKSNGVYEICPQAGKVKNAACDTTSARFPIAMATDTARREDASV